MQAYSSKINFIELEINFGVAVKSFEIEKPFVIPKT